MNERSSISANDLEVSLVEISKAIRNAQHKGVAIIGSVTAVIDIDSYPSGPWFPKSSFVVELDTTVSNEAEVG